MTRRTSARAWAALIVGGLVGGGMARAGCLVLKDGAAIEVRGEARERGSLVLFEDRTGTLRSLRGSEIDPAATAAATRSGICAGGGRPQRPNASPHAVDVPPPTGEGVHVPTAREILGALPVAPGRRRPGPPRGTSIDCSVVECGRVVTVEAPPAAARRTSAPAVATSAAGSGDAPLPAPSAQSDGGRLFGESFEWKQAPETSPSPGPVPQPRPVRRRRPPGR